MTEINLGVGSGATNSTPPKIIQTTKLPVRKGVSETISEIIPTSSVLPSLMDRVIRFRVSIAI